MTMRQWMKPQPERSRRVFNYPRFTDELLAENLTHLNETEGEVALAQLVEDRLDRMAGPWALTEQEREIRRLCRQRFGYFDPTNSDHIKYLRSLGMSSVDPEQMTDYEIAIDTTSAKEPVVVTPGELRSRALAILYGTEFQ